MKIVIYYYEAGFCLEANATSIASNMYVMILCARLNDSHIINRYGIGFWIFLINDLMTKVSLLLLTIDGWEESLGDAFHDLTFKLYCISWLLVPNFPPIVNTHVNSW